MMLPGSTLAVPRIPTPAHAAQCPSQESPNHCARYAALKPQSHENKSHLSLASTFKCQKESLVMASGIYLNTSKTASARPRTHPQASEKSPSRLVAQFAAPCSLWGDHLSEGVWVQEEVPFNV